MIKVYAKEKTLFFVEDMDFLNRKLMENKKICVINDCRTESAIKKSYSNAINDAEENEIVFFDKNLQPMFKLFQSIFKNIEAGGGLVKNKKEEYLFIFRNGKWDLPKGKREEGETIESCAIREVEEECGIKGLEISKQLPTTYHIYTVEGKEILKSTVWFEMKCDDTSELIPQREEGITEAKWFTKGDLKIVKNNTYPSIVDVMSEIEKK